MLQYFIYIDLNIPTVGCEIPGSSPGMRHFLVLGGRKVGRFFLIAVMEIDNCAWRARAQMPDLMAEYISFYIQASDRAPGRRARPLVSIRSRARPSAIS